MATAITPQETQQAMADMADSWRPRQHTAHTHRPAEDILRDLRVGSVERLMLWLSKTDVYALSLSPESNRMTLVSLGMMVCFTTILALLSGVYACQSMLIHPDSNWRWPVSLVLGGIYAFGIMLIDREIVGAISLKTLWLRVVFAVGIAMAVSYPVKIKFFEGRIDAAVDEIFKERHGAQMARLDELTLVGEKERPEQRASIQARIGSLDKEIAVLDVEIDKEARKVNCDIRCQRYREQKKQLMEQRTQAEQAMAALSGPAARPPHVEQEMASIRADLERKRATLYDFLSKWEAIERIKHDKNLDYHVLSSFVFGFFLLLELVPLGLKMSLGKTEYHCYLEMRANLNKQKIVAYNNLVLEKLQQEPASALTMPREITELVARQIEDEPMPTTDAAGEQELVRWLQGRSRAATATPALAGAAAVPATAATSARDLPTQDEPGGGQAT